MIFASALGSAGFLWIALALIAAVYPARRAAAWQLLLVVAFTLVITNYVIKPIVDRPRPFVAIAGLPVIDAKPPSTSFPSGHAARAVAGAIAGARLLPGAGWVLWPVGMLVAASRVYIGVHWPSDVVAGAVIGLACAWFVLGGRKTPVAQPKTSAIYS